jgi:UDP-N-acetylglucosamine--N-acetylmuramyl-(pentapeptide) pyrophosphoryl-undecaprenol N-acetylglucosamine transferase
MHIVFAAGGTAGHVEPALNTADALVKMRPETSISFIGGKRGLEGELVTSRGYPLVQVSSEPLPRRIGRQALSFPSQTLSAVRDARRHLASVRADAVVGFGGYAAVPGYLAAWRSGIPLIIHEANSRPGFANRLGARLTPHVASVHSGVLPHSRHLGLPLRPAISHMNRSALRTAARQEWGMSESAPVLLFFGGSQGARHLNEVLAAALDQLLGMGVEIIHAVGRNNVLPQSRPGYHPTSYIDRMDVAYAASDLAVCRAGAMTCAELTAVGLPGIYVPLPVGNGEQVGNSMPIVDLGGGVQCLDSAFTPEWLTKTVRTLVQDERVIADMSAVAASLGERDADQELAQWICEVGQRSGRD